jgi:LuxR family maltose regulon positive regulatory protein
MNEALAWARERGLSAEDDLSYLREFEHITLARLLLVQRSAADVSGLLRRLLEAAETGGRMGGMIEILVLQALAHEMRGDLPAALMPLARALTLADPEGYVRIFVDEGPPMVRLLEAAAKGGNAPGDMRQLLAAFGQPVLTAPAKESLRTQIEPLSQRELDVLRLLATDLDGPEIARELIVSLNTLRTHTRNLYSKLGVNNRRAAVKRAEELQLLSRTRKH